ncbi:MAG: site-2 protease family protein [Candidatus Omnitrophica bacterium]|nr:site-2 protease family protein [Candidatus Omnitrophota bacterium]
MGLISLLRSDPVGFIILIPVLLYSVIFHEVAHGLAAYFFGDDTAKRYGRLTLNPVSHIDPVGTLMLFFVGFGWAKPVPVDYYRLKNFRFGLFCVALSGCATNIFIATIALILLRLGNSGAHLVPSDILMTIAGVNIVLGAFNLIPIPPLDGSKILQSFLPESAQRSFRSLERYGFFILIILLLTGALNPVINFMQHLIYGLINVIFNFFA